MYNVVAIFPLQNHRLSSLVRFLQPFSFFIFFSAICAAIGGLGLIGGGICIGVLIYRKRRSPPSDNSDPEANKELEEFTYTAPTAQPSDQGKFIAMTVVKQEEASW